MRASSFIFGLSFIGTCLLVLALTACGGPSVSLPGPIAKPVVPKVEDPVTPKEDKKVEDAQKEINRISGLLTAAKSDYSSAISERDRAKREAEVKPVRYVLITGASLGSVGVLAGVSLYAFSLIWSFGFGSKFGLGIAGVGGACLVVSLGALWLLDLSLEHFTLILVVLGGIIVIGVCWAVWNIHTKATITAAQFSFGEAAANKLKQLEDMAGNSSVAQGEIHKVATVAWQSVKGPEVAKQIKSGVHKKLDKIRANLKIASTP